ncbi:MAG TPA: hypothetical protein VIK04_12785 [Solirubrobacteraceae bacterium]
MSRRGAALGLVWTAAMIAAAGCGAAASTLNGARAGTTHSVSSGDPGAGATASHAPRRARPTPAYPSLLASAQSSRVSEFVPVVRWRGRTAVWSARSPSGIALLSFDQRLIELRLHSGTIDAGSSGWRWGPAAVGSERRRLVAAFNGGFKLSTGAGGFMSYGRIGAPLRSGLGSVVTYAGGRTDIGAWHVEVPTSGTPVVSVRQNLTLLIDHGRPAASVDCLSCWGAILGGVSDPARSALGVTADGRVIWAAGEHVTVAQLAAALLGARVGRAVELDINPEWVAGYLYGHRSDSGALAPVPVVPGQNGVPGFFLAPYSRDFFTVVAR